MLVLYLTAKCVKRIGTGVCYHCVKTPFLLHPTILHLNCLLYPAFVFIGSSDQKVINTNVGSRRRFISGSRPGTPSTRMWGCLCSCTPGIFSSSDHHKAGGRPLLWTADKRHVSNTSDYASEEDCNCQGNFKKKRLLKFYFFFIVFSW